MILEPIQTPEDILLAKDRRRMVERAMQHRLLPREERAVRLRYGFDCDPCTYDQIGAQLGGITRERVRQIVMKAQRKLWRAVDDTGEHYRAWRKRMDDDAAYWKRKLEKQEADYRAWLAAQKPLWSTPTLVEPPRLIPRQLLSPPEPSNAFTIALRDILNEARAKKGLPPTRWGLPLP